MSKCDEPLHGLTVVIDTPSDRLYIGRFDVEDERGILLRDVDVREPEAGVTKEAYLAKTAKFGVFRNADQVWVRPEEIASVRKLSEISPAP